MAKFSLNCDVTVKGKNIKSINDAITAIQTMLDDFEDMNPVDINGMEISMVINEK